MARPSGRPWIGVSGYDYPHWGKGAFYPEDVPRRSWLSYAARFFNSVEINGTFYSLKNPEVFRRWIDATPDRGFVFAVKGSRFITHNLKLRNAEPALANFFASGVLLLGRKTGPFLWQLPASYRFDPGRIEGFLDTLPWSSKEAETLAREHDHRLKRGSAVEAAEHVSYRHALEVRHPSYFHPEFYDLLRRRELDVWAKRVEGWVRGRPARDVCVYFDNDHQACAPHDAIGLRERLERRLAALTA